MPETLVTAEELVKLLGISSATVNYYTNLGLFKIKDRLGNRRLYEKNEIKELHEQIRKMRREGYSLRIIQERMQKGYRI
jgi:DNA-binding transcriptional MerR regulator